MENFWEIKDGSLYVGTKGQQDTYLRYPKAIPIDHEFAKVSFGQKWGCVNKYGILIIPILYDVIYKQVWNNDTYFICGKEGEFFIGKNKNDGAGIWGLYGMTTALIPKTKNRNELKEVYTGKFDLFDQMGNLITGGFNDIQFDAELTLFFILFGREWFLDPNYMTYKFRDDTLGKWIILDKDFKIPYDKYNYGSINLRIENIPEIKRGESIKTKIFKSISLGNLRVPQDILQDFKSYNNSATENEMILDFPQKYVFNRITEIKGRILIVKQEHKYFQIDLDQKLILGAYDYLSIYKENITFVLNAGSIGLIRNDSLKLPCEYEILTFPVNGWCFGIIYKKEIDKYLIQLIKIPEKNIFINVESFGIRVTDPITEEQLVNLLKTYTLKLVDLNNGKDGLDSIAICNTPETGIKFNSQLNLLISNHYEIKDIKSQKIGRYFISKEELDRIINPDDYSYDEEYEKPNHEIYDIGDALDGVWDAYSNIMDRE